MESNHNCVKPESGKCLAIIAKRREAGLEVEKEVILELISGNLNTSGF